MLITSLLSIAFFGGIPAQNASGLSSAENAVLFAGAQISTTDFDSARCRSIADLSSKSQPLFQQKDNGEWECTYLLDYVETGHAPSVFIQIRGVEAGRWTSFRLKLNFGSLLSRQVLGDRAAAIVYTLIGNQTPLRELGLTLASGQEFEVLFSGISLKYKQERFDKARFNLSGTSAQGQNRVPVKP